MPAAGDDLGCSSRRAETLSYALRECIGYVVWVRSCTGSQTKDSSVAVRSRFRYLREGSACRFPFWPRTAIRADESAKITEALSFVTGR